MSYIVSYIAALIVFGAVDAVWLSAMAARLYRPTLGPVLLDQLRKVPALIFYVAYPIGLVFFAVMPAIAADSIVVASFNGGLFGLLAYATYDLTNMATLRRWTWTLALTDMAYGTVVAALTSGASFYVTRWWL